MINDESYLLIQLTNVRGVNNDTLVAETFFSPLCTAIFMWDDTSRRFINPLTGGRLVSIDEIFYLEIEIKDDRKLS